MCGVDFVTQIRKCPFTKFERRPVVVAASLLIQHLCLRSFVSTRKNGRTIWLSKACWSTDRHRRTVKTCFAVGRRCPTIGSTAESRWTVGTKKSNSTRSAVNRLRWNRVIRKGWHLCHCSTLLPILWPLSSVPV